MNRKIFLPLAVFMCAFLTTLTVNGADTAPSTAPAAQVPEATHQFAPVFDGQEVVYDFMVKNSGTAELAIQNVKTG